MLFSLVTTSGAMPPSKNLELLPSRTPSEAHLSTSGHRMLPPNPVIVTRLRVLGIPTNDDDLTGWWEASQVDFFGCFPSNLTNKKQGKKILPRLSFEKKKVEPAT